LKRIQATGQHGENLENMPLEKNEKPWTNKKNNKNGMISEGRLDPSNHLFFNMLQKVV